MKPLRYILCFLWLLLPTTWASPVSEAKAEQLTPAVSIHRISEHAKAGDVRSYIISASEELSREDALIVGQAFSQPDLEAPNLLDVLQDYFVVSVENKYFYVTKMKHRGFTLIPMTFDGHVLRHNNTNSKLIGKVPNAAKVISKSLLHIDSHKVQN